MTSGVEIGSSLRLTFRCPWVHIPTEATLPKTNIAPENGWLEDEFPFGAFTIFMGVCCLFLGVYPTVKLLEEFRDENHDELRSLQFHQL